MRLWRALWIEAIWGALERGGDLLAAASVLREEGIRICLNRALIEDHCGVHIDKRHCEPLSVRPTWTLRFSCIVEHPNHIPSSSRTCPARKGKSRPSTSPFPCMTTKIKDRPQDLTRKRYEWARARDGPPSLVVLAGHLQGFVAGVALMVFGRQG